MKKLCLGLLVTLCSVKLFGAINRQAQELDVNNFSKGLDSYHDSTVIQDGYVQDALNVYFDKQAPVEKRQGYSLVFSSKSYAYTNAWQYTDTSNTTWLIVRSSDSILASNLGGFVTRIATVSVNDSVDEVNVFGNAYFVDQTQGVYYWNGVSTVFISSSPKGSIITQFHNRVWVAGQPVPNGNILNGSKFLDGTIWTTGLNPNDPVQFTIGLQDSFDNITAIYPFLDTLYITKYTSIFALYGFDNTNFQNSILTRECGCVDKNSIQSFNKGIVLVSLRGLEFYDGYNCTRISDPVKNKIDSAIQSTSFSQSTWLQSTQADWSAGTISPSVSLSTTQAAPALKPSSGRANYTGSSFNAGNFNNTRFDGLGLSLSINNGNVTNHAFESGNSWWTPFTGFTDGASFDFNNIAIGFACTVNVRSTGNFFYVYRSHDLSPSVDVNAYVKSCKDNSTLYNFTFNNGYNSCGWTKRTIPMSGMANKCVFLEFRNDNLGFDYLESGNFIASGSDITFYTASDSLTNPAVAPQGLVMTFDDFTDGANLITSGTYSSAVLDLGNSNNTLYSTTTYSVSAYADAPYVEFQKSGDGTSWTPINPSNIGSNVAGDRYTRFISSFTQVSNDDITEQILTSAFNITATSGTLKSQIKNVGTLNSFGNFLVNESLNGGNVAFSICSSSNSNMSAPFKCADQTANSQISVATNTFIQVYSTFSITSATQVPVLNNFSVQWFTGAKAVPMASVVYDNRYWLSGIYNNSDTVNDGILVMNPSQAFTFFDIHAGGLVAVKNNLYHANSQADGDVYLDNQGYVDDLGGNGTVNGVPITAYIRTRDYTLGPWIADTILESLWPSIVNLGNYPVDISYNLDKSPNDLTLATINQNEFATTKFSKIQFSMSNGNKITGQTVNFKIGANAINEPFQFEGMSLLYHERPVQE